MNRSAKGLSIVTTNMDGFSLANRRRFAKLLTCQTFPVYGNPLAARLQQSNNTLVVGVHQSEANTSDPLAADEQLRINDARDPHKGHQLENESSVDF